MSVCHLSTDERAAIVAEILHTVAATPDSVSYTALFTRVRTRMGRPEEVSGEAIMHATSILVLSGVLRCSTHDACLGQITYGVDTRLSAGARLLGFVWDEDLPSAEDDDDA